MLQKLKEGKKKDGNFCTHGEIKSNMRNASCFDVNIEMKKYRVEIIT
jgi:hypothetical protein